MALFLSLVFVAGLCVDGGWAQVLPENHYLVYDVPEAYTFGANIELLDQFRYFQTAAVVLDLFANPVMKNNEPIFDPLVHQTWWMLNDPQSIWWTTLQNQFGVQRWQVKDGRFLVLPALKNQSGPVPPWNHYKCYDAMGPALNIPVMLVDQFRSYSMVVTTPVLFCNPVEKKVDGVLYPIVHHETHLACYMLEPPMQYGLPVMAFDQFGDWHVTPIEPCWLCLPTLKLETVPGEETTWGKIKSLWAE
jgi:hypothetical protein